MHDEADIELRLLRAAQEELAIAAARHPLYDPAVEQLLRKLVATDAFPHHVVVPMSRRSCRAVRQAPTWRWPMP